MESQRSIWIKLRKLIILTVIFSFIGTMTINAFPATVAAKSKIKLNKATITLCKGTGFSLKVSGTRQKVKWETGNKSVVTVTSLGRIAGKKVGTTKIKATIGKTKLQCIVKVRNHSYSAATCMDLKQCTRCDKETGDYADHKYTETMKAVSKLEQGYTEYICSICDESHHDQFVDYQVTEEMAYDDMMLLKPEYPEGMPWTNDDYYGWLGGVFSGGYGCAGFAFAMSDAAFGYLPARKHNDLEQVKVGDILRINGNTHSVIVIERYDNYVVVAEGNYNSSIHWGRTFTFNELSNNCDYIMTRYPDEVKQ